MAVCMPTGRSAGDRQGGYTYLALLFLVAAVGIGMAKVGELWETASLREKERELLGAGREIRDAIGRYYLAADGGSRRYPPRLEDLLKDSRVPGVRRFMRRIPIDPMTGARDWVIVTAPGGGVMGVHSRFDGSPLKKIGFGLGEQEFDGAKSYSGWRFTYVPVRS